MTPGPKAVAALPGWEQAATAPIANALRSQCRGRWLTGAPDESSRRMREASCALLDQAPDERAMRQAIARGFVAWPIVEDTGLGVGLMTGYHEPLVTGSRERQSETQAPLYGPPARAASDASPGPTRAEIAVDPRAAGVAGRELVWVDDPIEAFFLQIQGSGRIRLRDGSIMRVGFAAHNRHPYHAIGRTLIASGELTRESLSADAIKDWLRRNPNRAAAVMQTNPRVVFFRELPATHADARAPGAQGPIGALGVPLTARASVAVDLDRLPAGALLYGRDLQAPPGAAGPGLLIAQDRGGAIRGAVRIDRFTGSDDAAAREASALNAPVRMWLLWPRGARPPGGLPLAWTEPPL
ncbi:MAG: MltA domain-containing protein [Burkholderiaceae bacterium]